MNSTQNKYSATKALYDIHTDTDIKNSSDKVNIEWKQFCHWL
jgi:hypothetical protein